MWENLFPNIYDHQMNSLFGTYSKRVDPLMNISANGSMESVKNLNFKRLFTYFFCVYAFCYSHKKQLVLECDWIFMTIGSQSCSLYNFYGILKHFFFHSKLNKFLWLNIFIEPYFTSCVSYEWNNKKMAAVVTTT